MTITIIILGVTAWIILSAFFSTAACALSAQLRQATLAGDEQSSYIWMSNEGELPTTPVGSLR